MRGSVHPSGGVSSLGSCVGVCSSVMVYQGLGVGWECAV